MRRSQEWNKDEEASLRVVLNCLFYPYMVIGILLFEYKWIVDCERWSRIDFYEFGEELVG